MTEQELNKACEIVRDLANDHFGDWEQSCKFEDAFRKAMTDKTNPLFEKCLANVNPETREEVRRNMDCANWTENACEFLNARLFPTVKVQDNEIYVINRWELIDEFRKAMGEKSGKPTSPWRKASDELPNEGEHILFAKSLCEGGTPYYETVYYPEPGITDGIDYWMPIPELPKED